MKVILSKIVFAIVRTAHSYFCTEIMFISRAIPIPTKGFAKI